MEISDKIEGAKRTGKNLLRSAVLTTILAVPIVGAGIYFSDKSNRVNDLRTESEKVQSIETKVAEKEYSSFGHQSEKAKIIYHAKRVGVEPELLMAIRDAENGGAGREYGILPAGDSKNRYQADAGYSVDGKFVPYTDSAEKQLCWAAWTVKKAHDRYIHNSEGHKDFTSYLAAHYAPQGVSNDPKGLNSNWERNVRYKYKLLESED